MSLVLDALRPVAIELASIFIAAFVAWLTAWLRTRFKVDLDERHRATLETALTNAAGMLLAGATREAAFLYVERGAGDAVRHFGLQAPDIFKKLDAKEALAKAGALPR